MWLLLPASSVAATLTVPGDFSNVREAVNAAYGGDVIEVSTGTWDGPLLVDKDLTLRAVDGPGTAVLTASVLPFGFAVVNVTDWATVTLDGIWIDGQAEHRALFVASAEVVASDLSLVDPMDGAWNDAGGAIVVDYGASLELVDPVFTEQVEGVDDGGYVMAWDSYVTIRGGLFEGGLSWTGAGGAVTVVGSSLVIEDTTFRGNAAASDGGGLTAWWSEVTLTDVVFEGNEAGLDPYDAYDGVGGGTYLYDCDGAVLERLRFDGNVARAGGGAFLDDTDDLLITETDFVDNAAPDIAGGLGIYYSAWIDLEGLRFEGNDAWMGGGLWFEDGYDLSVTGALFCANTADYGGGAAIGYLDGARIENAVFAANEVYGSGAALDAYWYADVALHDAHLLGNVGAALLADGADIDLRNSLVAWTAGPAFDEVYGNIREDHDAWWGNAEDPGGLTSPVRADPMLRGWSEADPCRGDFRPDEASPLIDAGFGVDGDGSTADIGAYGGPGWDAIDFDRDGVPGRLDCADFDPATSDCEPPPDTGDTGLPPTDTGTVEHTGHPPTDGQDTSDTGVVLTKDVAPKGLPPVFFCATGPSGGSLGALLLALAAWLPRRRQRNR
ncbi:MAG: hypothetical protein KC621_01850 [Myxococcales bacterium]|nr:hypothetical protein [Myxococcales bacterium]